MNWLSNRQESLFICRLHSISGSSEITGPPQQSLNLKLRTPKISPRYNIINPSPRRKKGRKEGTKFLHPFSPSLFPSRSYFKLSKSIRIKNTRDLLYTVNSDTHCVKQGYVESERKKEKKNRKKRFSNI